MRILRVAAAVAVLAGTAAAQREARIVSPEVNADRTITFRLKGPEVKTAAVSAGWIGKEPKAMVKGADGVWSATLGPVEPDILDYSYRIDGVQTIDPHNARVKVWLGGAASLVEVPGEAPLYYDLQDVPHGEDTRTTTARRQLAKRAACTSTRRRGMRPARRATRRSTCCTGPATTRAPGPRSGGRT